MPEVVAPRRLAEPNGRASGPLPPTRAALARENRAGLAEVFARGGRARLPGKGDGLQLTVQDRRLLTSLARYGVLSWRQAQRWIYDGKANKTSTHVGRLAEAGFLTRSQHEGWPGVVMWLARPGQVVANEIAPIPLERLSTPPPTERLLHRLAVNDIGFRFEAGGATVLTEREIRACEQGSKLDAGGVAARLGVTPKRVADGRNRRRFFAVPMPGEDAVHFPDLVVIRDGQMRAVEVELTVKDTSRAVHILRGYTYSGLFTQVQYHTVGDVRVMLEGWRDGHDDWQPGWLHQVKVLQPGPPTNTADPYIRVFDLAPTDDAVAWRIDMRQVPEHMWVTKREWARLRAIWSEHPSATLPASRGERPARVPFLTWWRRQYPLLRQEGLVA